MGNYGRLRDGINEFKKTEHICPGCSKSDYFPYKTGRGTAGKDCTIYCGYCGKIVMFFYYRKDS